MKIGACGGHLETCGDSRKALSRRKQGFESPRERQLIRLRLARRTVSTEGGKVRRQGGSDQATDIWDHEVSPGAQTGFTHYTGLQGSLDSHRLDQLHKKVVELTRG
jgi:hypothetical protein